MTSRFICPHCHNSIDPQTLEAASSAGTQRCFCGHCGSPVISIKAETPDFYRLRIGTLDTPLAQRPVCHIFTASKAEWEQIADDLPQYAERP